jgi:thioesterase domain-containing protein
LDGIGNSNLVNSDVTFDAHKEQTEQSLIDFDLDEETRKEMVLNSWHLLNLSIKHSISTIDLPQLDLFLLMIARQTTTKDYGWPKQRGMYRLLKVDGDHLSMMNEERSTSLVRRVIEEICRAKNSKRQ